MEQPIYERRGHRLQGRGDGFEGWYCACGLVTMTLSPQAFGPCPLRAGPEGEMIEDRLEKLAQRLRAEGAIFGPERDLMVDAAAMLRDARRDLTSSRRIG